MTDTAAPAPRVQTAGTISTASNLTQAQFLIWMGQRLFPTTPLYNMVMTFTIRGPVQVPAFRSAFDALVEHTDAMRTVFIEADGIPQRRVLPHAPHDLPFRDLSGETDPARTLRSWITERAVYTFPLDERLFDSALLQTGPEEFVWYLNQHHLITDGWSKAIVFARLEELYRHALASQSAATLSYPSFESYVEYEREYRRSTSFRKARAYWERKVAEPRDALNFYGVSPPDGGTTRTERIVLDVGRDRSRRLRDLAGEEGVRRMTVDVSLFNIFATVLVACLARISGQRELAILAPAHNRPSKQFKQTAGLFIEVLPLHISIAEDETLGTLLEKVAVEAHAFLIKARPGTSSAAQNRAYGVLLNVINAAFSEFAGSPTRSEWIHPGHGDHSHSLRLQVHDFDRSGSFKLHFDLSRAVFDEWRQRAIVRHFGQMLDALLDDRKRGLGDVDLLSDEEKQRHLIRFNDTAAAYPEGTVVQAFDAQVARTPDATALEFGAERVSYRELHARSNRLARELTRLGVAPGTRVGLCLERSPETVVAIWGVLKAGGCYVPIDPRYPTERIAFLLRDSDVHTVLTQESLRARLPRTNANVLCLPLTPGASAETLGEEMSGDLTPQASPEDPAYVIYTSGSTGTPKGVVVSHRGLLNYVCWARSQYQQGTVLDYPLYSSLTFDLTVTSIYVPLLSGATVVVYREDDRRDLAILRVFEDDRVDVVKLTPSHLTLLRNHDLSGSRIKKLIVGGENLTAALAKSIFDASGGRMELYNEYGPTEATVGCMVHRFDPECDTDPSVPLGRPAANVQIYILDHALRPVPMGVVGELCIAGHGVALGYLNRREATAERFVEDPFRAGGRLYRTGDLARWRAPERIEFVGRADDQIKIRGARVEPAEVEAVLLTHPDVREGVVHVIETELDSAVATVRYCVECGLASNHPEAHLNTDGVCQVCLAHRSYAAQARRYFGTMDDLRAIFRQTTRSEGGEYDCLMLLSGGKDSTYALYQLVDMGLRVLVFSLDNGYISDGAKANIRRAVDDLGLELVFGTTPAMNDIFADSLRRFSNVCQGCFKTIYTLGLNLARSRGIPVVITGLSRGQIVETRLAPLFRNGTFDPTELDRAILDARRAYHQMDDVVARSLDVKIFEDPRLFDEVMIVDFYRYCDVTLADMLGFLDERAPWVRPPDTGRSTNCLINDVGIYVHKKERGYHNYALPYSWDVRLGHKTRASALAELDDEIDVTRVRRILEDVGYAIEKDEDVRQTQTSLEKRLTAYYVSSNRQTTPSLVRTHLAQHLPDHTMPSYIVRLETMPLTSHGKVDRRALPDPRHAKRPDDRKYAAPRTETEQRLVGIWEAVLGVEGIGVHDDFIELGGDSILNIQIVAKAKQAGFSFTPKDLFEHPTIADLAALPQVAATEEFEGPATGSVELTPIQHWFFELDLERPNEWSHAVLLQVPQDLDMAHLERAFRRVTDHHDMLRAQFARTPEGWRQTITPHAPPVAVHHVDVSAVPSDERAGIIATTTDELNRSISLENGELVKLALLEDAPGGTDRLVIVIHHLVVDAISWSFLLEDLETAYMAAVRGRTVRLPPRTTSFKEWSRKLGASAASDTMRQQRDYWMQPGQPTDASISLPPDDKEAPSGTVSLSLGADLTTALLRDVPPVYNTRVDDALLAALAQAFARWTGMTSMRVNLEGHGREDVVPGVDLTRTLGWFTCLYPVTLALPKRDDPGTVLKSIKEQIRRVPDRGIGYGMLRYLRRDVETARQLASQPDAQVLFNYLGRFDSVAANSSVFRLDAPLRLVRGSTARRPHVLEINAYLDAGEMCVDFAYAPGILRSGSRDAGPAMDTPVTDETVRTLTRHFTEALRQFVAHARANVGGGFTPSDFPEAGLSQDELDDILDTFGESQA